jgi:hypothetical protein
MQEQSNLEFADAITARIGTLINNRFPIRTNEDALEALMMTIAEVIIWIDCRDCRAAAVKKVKTAFPKIMDWALDEAINRRSDDVH